LKIKGCLGEGKKEKEREEKTAGKYREETEERDQRVFRGWPKRVGPLGYTMKGKRSCGGTRAHPKSNKVLVAINRKRTKNKKNVTEKNRKNSRK